MLFLMGAADKGLAATRYVDVNSASPSPPYTNWATAARVIQDAVDAAVVGDEILVTNGVYATGGRVVYGTLTNRVAVDKPLRLRSVNGPQFTAITGYQVPGITNGDGAVRCVYLTNGACLSGFTLTNGATRTGEGWPREDTGGGLWCESTNAIVCNCLIAGNVAAGDGGGAYRGTLNDCTLLGNSAVYHGGGAYGSTLNNCTLRGNSVRWVPYFGGFTGDDSSVGGGGACMSTLNNCTVASNFGFSGQLLSFAGGGVRDSALNNCILTGNSAENGGGAYCSTLNNCVVTGNSGGGVAGYLGRDYYTPCVLNNCMVVGNDWGTYLAWAANCVIYYNGTKNSEDGSLDHCCTTPLPASGVGNITADPQLASASHLSPGSPCIGRGMAGYANGVDIDGEPWANPPSIGCDEYWTGAVTGAISGAILASYTNVAAGFRVDFQALINGRVSASRWDFGDGVIVSNRPFASHAWGAAGDYLVELRVYNESHPVGIAVSVRIQVADQPVHYVALDSANPVPPYSSWATAATNIQDAVDAAALPGALVLVTNGVYQTGARAVYGMSNRVAVTKPLKLMSVNGAEVTTIVGFRPGGSNAVRCVYLTNGAMLAGFTLTNGATQTSGHILKNQSGGGVWCESASAVVSNCVLTGNSGAYGGGAFGGQLNNCTLADNQGNGAYYATLSNCTLIRNQGDGAYYATLNNCTLISNQGRGASDSTLNNCTLVGNQVGGAFSGTLNNCTVIGNQGSGAYYGTLNNCLLTGNSASKGGGALYATLNNCTLTGNSATNYGGGAYSSTLNNCIVYYNAAPSGANYSGGTFNYCCTTPLPAGMGNSTNAPLFMDTNGWSNLRLQSNSPSVNAGNNTYVSSATDLDGNPRIIGGTVDMGAYEFLIPGGWPPVILAQPQDLRVNVGGTAQFSIVAQSPIAMDYQWLFNNSPIPGETNATLVLPDVWPANAAAYAVVVSNLLGSVTSSNALLTINRYPIADASATVGLVISANGADARVVLDGSRSSDPDGDPLQYWWFPTLNAQPATLLGTGVVAVVVLPVGIHPISLVVSDGMAASTNMVTVTELTTSQNVQRLIGMVNESGVAHAKPLLASLEAALASINRGNQGAASNQLHAFQNKVRAQVGRSNPGLAQALITAAQQIIDALEGAGASGEVAGKLHSAKHQKDGKLQLKFSGTTDRLQVVEASTNLVDWEIIGVATEQGDGLFGFEDPNASKFPGRYYRIRQLLR